VIRASSGLIPLLILLPRILHADDWPMFGGRPDRNLVAGEKGLPAVIDPKKSAIKWTAELGKTTYGNPVVSEGRVYIGTNNEQPRDPAEKGDRGVLMCFSEADGKFLWQATHEKLGGGDGVDAAFIGLCSTPCATGGRIYYVSNRCELVCREAKDGKLVWLLDMRKDLGVLQNQASVSSPLVVGDLVFIVTGQGADHKSGKVKNPKAPSFLAVDRASGKLVWQDATPGAGIISAQWGSPAYAVVEGQPQVVFPGGDGWLYAFEPATGTLIWKFNCKAHEKVTADGTPETANQLVGMPVYSGHRVLIATGIDTDTNGPGALRAIDARKKGDVTKTAELWRISGDDFTCSISTVAVQEGLVYAVQMSGLLDCIDLETGKKVWRHDLLSNAWGSPLVADGKVYVRDGDGEIVVLQAGREKKLLAKNGDLPGLEHGTVVAANGALYIAGKSKLYAIAGTK
jgi:outer membrane protein assembly factor BamB